MTKVLTAAAAALVLLAAGCGGSDDGDEPAAPSKPEYISRGDAICQKLYEQRDPLETQATAAAQSGDSGRAADIFENAASITKNRMEELGGVPAPQGDQAEVDEIVARGRETATVALAAAEAIRGDDAKRLARESSRGLRVGNAFNKAAVGYGFLVCGRGPATEIG